ncbi:MAG: type II secretion system F family protein [Lachnospiraceae bacterium]|nr:type II secretion system F family protein [Lachnospiraceae bacterium]
MNLVDVYYQIREKLGKAPVSRNRLKDAELLFPGKNSQEFLRAEDERLLRKAVALFLCAAAIFVCAVVIRGFNNNEIISINRPQYGEGDAIEPMQVSLGEEKIKMDVSVSERELTAEEKEKLFDTAKKKLIKSLFAENEGAEKVDSPLNFAVDTGSGIVAASWQISDYSLIRYDGTLLYPKDFTDGITTTVRLHLTIGEEKREYPVELTLYRPKKRALTAEEQVKSAISAEDEKDPFSETVSLPRQIGETAVSYEKPGKDAIFSAVPVITAAAVFALFLREKTKRKEKMTERKTELETAYSEMVSKLAVLTGSGYTIQKAWEKLADEFKKEKRPDAGNYLSEEMEYSLRQIKNGASCEAAMTRLGERTGLPEYMRLTGILVSSMKNGRDNLDAVLAAETRDAFEKRLLIAKRQGEKISSRLLAPMLMQFVLIVTLLIIPAFLSW